MKEDLKKKIKSNIESKIDPNIKNLLISALKGNEIYSQDFII